MTISESYVVVGLDNFSVENGISYPYASPMSNDKHKVLFETRISNSCADLVSNDRHIVVFEIGTPDAHADPKSNPKDFIKSERSGFEGKRLPFKEW